MPKTAAPLFSVCLAIVIMTTPASAKTSRPLTFCNPLDLPYRFTLRENPVAGGVSAREAADPTVIFYGGRFWLFASKSGGYWHSTDLVRWTFVRPTGYPVEEYAPTVAVVDGKWLLLNSEGSGLYSTDDPETGLWVKKCDVQPVSDPALFADDDGKLYLYSGSSNVNPIMGVELDPAKNFAPIGHPRALLSLDPLRHGWEARHPFATDAEIRDARGASYIEGAWMTKHKGVYYLQYAAPGTEENGYADGVYTSKSPLGPYHYALYSPFSYRPTGFAPGAGHGSLFKDADGRLWHATTHFVGTGFKFDRRIGIHPAEFLPGDGEPDQLIADTYLGDYPQLAPGHARESHAGGNLAGWMLLSLHKPAIASSTLDAEHAPARAFDENIATSWAAATGNPGEWLQVDFGNIRRIDAVQVNFADIGSTAHGHLNDAYRYKLEISDDGLTWRTLVDKTDNQRDAPHEYIQLDAPITARFAKITNVHTPGGAVFSLSELRFFGNGLGKSPKRVRWLKAERQTNRRLAKIAWKPSADADFYIIRYGVRPDRLTQNQQIYGGCSATIAGLNTDAEYYVTVDAVNDSGITRGSLTQRFFPASTP